MIGIALIGVVVLDDLILGVLVGPFVMGVKFRGGITSVLLVGG